MRWVLVLLVLLAASCREVFGLEQPVRLADAGDSRDSTVDGNDGWWDLQWRSRRKVTINTSLLAGTLTDFPILVTFRPGQAGGTSVSDLRFVSADGVTVLDHDVDTFADETARIWVRVPVLTNSVPAATLWLYYENPNAVASANPAGVFASQASVHHLGATLDDVSGHAHTGNAPVGSEPSVVAGLIGSARGFDGVDDYIEIADPVGFSFTTSMSASMWFNASSFTSAYQALLTKGDDTWRIQRHDATAQLAFGTSHGSVNANLAGTATIGFAQWHQVAVVLESGTKRLYIDGVLDASANVASAIDMSSILVSIGRNLDFAGRNWHGAVDEVRISAVPRSPAWILAEHLTVTSSTLVTLGQAEERP